MNNIIELLNLEDSQLQITSIQVTDKVKTITVETEAVPHYCPVCGFRMHSKGIHLRTVNHPILQDTFKLTIKLKQRRWKCTNDICGYTANESFRFVSKGSRQSNASDMLIVSAFKDLNKSAAAIARQFHTSDTHVLNMFDTFVHMERLPLSSAISIDEVYLNMDANCKYVLVIQDFHTGQPIDMLISRRNNVTEPYFAMIPIEERAAVKYLISDMYSPYLSYVRKYFPNAVSVVDSFHVLQWINHELELYLRGLKRKYRERDMRRHAIREAEAGRKLEMRQSDEMYLLQRYSWLIMMNKNNRTYHIEPRLDRHFRYLMNTYDYEDMFFQLDENLEELRDLKDLYSDFNSRNAGDPMGAQAELDDLIVLYANCDQDIFRRFAITLDKYRDPIIQSFVMVDRIRGGRIDSSRLSNGPIESLNRKAKDLKRLARGYRNFNHIRNRFLFATRTDPALDGKLPIEYPIVYLDEE